MASVPPRHPAWGKWSRRDWMTLVIGVAVMCAIVAALFTIPVPRGFSFTISEHRAQGTPKYPLFSLGWWNESFPIGARVSGSWSSGNSTSVYLDIYTPSVENAIYSPMNSTAGSFSFTADYDYYLFSASSYSTPVSVQVSGTYTMPLL